MNKFTLNDIKRLIKKAMGQKPTGNSWLDSRYNEQLHIQGHTMPYYKLFYYLAQKLNPECVVELGSFQATGAAHFACGNSDTTVFTIDIHKDDKNAQQRCYEAMKQCPNLHYINKWTWDAVDDIKSYKKPIDILFIDAWHKYDMVKREWELYQPLLNDNALVIFDDITEDYNFEGMITIWNEISKPFHSFTDNKLHITIPMGFLKYEKSKLATNRKSNKNK